MDVYPTAFYVVLLLLVIGFGVCVSGLRRGWGLPGIVVLLTVSAWYVGDAVYNDYTEYFLQFGTDTLEAAWWQVAIFVLVFTMAVAPTHNLLNAKLKDHESFAIKSYERKLINELQLQAQIDRVFGVIAGTWIALMAIALYRTGWDFGGLFFPYFVGHNAYPWSRGRIGGGADALLSFALYLQLFLTSALGLLWALAHNTRTRTWAGILFLLSAPYFVFGRARNTILAVLTPTALAWVMIRLRTTWLVRAVILGALFAVLNFWMAFVVANRDEMISQAVRSNEAFARAAESEHKGLNMFAELSWINHFMKLGTYQPNWGARYWADFVNPIPRGLWPGKPMVGLDYAVARGMGEGGYAAEQEEGVAATISTGMIGQGVVNFGTLLGPAFAALLMAFWVALLARQDLRAEEHPARFLLYALGIILTFNMGRDITFIVTYPFFFGYAFVYYLERKKGVGATGGRGQKEQRTAGGRRPETGRRGDQENRRTEGLRDQQTKRLKDQRTKGPRDQRTIGQETGVGGQGAGRKRVPRWAPVSQRAAARRERVERPEVAEERTNRLEDQGTEGLRDLETKTAKDQETKGLKDEGRPRQLSVPYRNYRRYRA